MRIHAPRPPTQQDESPHHPKNRYLYTYLVCESVIYMGHAMLRQAQHLLAELKALGCFDWHPIGRGHDGRRSGHRQSLSNSSGDVGLRNTIQLLHIRANANLHPACMSEWWSVNVWQRPWRSRSSFHEPIVPYAAHIDFTTPTWYTTAVCTARLAAT